MGVWAIASSTTDSALELALIIYKRDDQEGHELWTHVGRENFTTLYDGIRLAVLAESVNLPQAVVVLGEEVQHPDSGLRRLCWV